MPSLIVHSSTEKDPFTLKKWAILETEEELMEMWERGFQMEQMPTIKAAHRRSEWLASRLLMRELGITTISYLSNGKPVSPGCFISLSHSSNEVALVVSTTEVGLDIQFVNEKISIIRSRFCSDTEWQWLQVHPESLRALTIVWSAKEAVFKYYGEEVEFAEHMQVMPFKCTDETIFLHYKGVHGERSFSLRHLTLDGLEVLVAL